MTGMSAVASKFLDTLALSHPGGQININNPQFVYFLPHFSLRLYIVEQFIMHVKQLIFLDFFSNLYKDTVLKLYKK